MKRENKLLMMSRQTAEPVVPDANLTLLSSYVTQNSLFAKILVTYQQKLVLSWYPNLYSWKLFNQYESFGKVEVTETLGD